jgi:hypothetical protein
MCETKIGNGDPIQWFLVGPKEENENEWKKKMESIHFTIAIHCIALLLLLHVGETRWLSHYCYTTNAK